MVRESRKTTKKRYVKIELELDIVTKLLKMKEFGDTYSDVVRRVLKNAKL